MLSLRPGSSSLRDIAAYGIFVLLAIYLLMPWQPTIGHGLDYGWTLMLNLVYLNGLKFGTDVLFTYGSWGFVEHATYYPQTRAVVLVLNLLLIVLWSASVWLAAGHWMARNRWWRIVGFLAVIVAALVFNPWFGIVFTTGFMIALVPCRARLNLAMLRKPSFAQSYRWSLAIGWAGLMTFAGVASHMKLSYFVVIIGCIGAMTLGLLIRPAGNATARRSAWLTAAILPVIYLLAWLAAWLGIGQRFANLPAYLDGVRQIVSSYGEAMSYPGPWWQGVELFIVVVCVYAMAIRLIYVTRPSTTRPTPAGLFTLQWRLFSLVRVLAAAGVLFIAFKSAIVRQGDGHFTLIGGTLLAISAAVTTALISNAWSGRSMRGAKHSSFNRLERVALSLVFIVIAITGCMTMSVVHGSGPMQYFRNAIQGDRLNAMLTFMRHGDAHVYALWRNDLQETREKRPWGSYELTTDIYPTRLDIGIKSGYPMSPRLTLQGYVAANDKLLRLNANHLLGPDAPQQIVLVNEEPLDHQYPAFSDSLSWPWLLTHYDLTRQVKNDVVLQRNDQPRALRLVPLSSERIQMRKGALVPAVPAGAQGIWATVTLKPSLWGKWRGLFYKRPVMMMDLIMADGSHMEARFMPQVAKAGFLLSPHVDFGPRWLAFATGGVSDAASALPGSHEIMSRNSVTAMRIRPIDGVLDWPSYEDDIEVTYWGFHFEPQQLRRTKAK